MQLEFFIDFISSPELIIAQETAFSPQMMGSMV
jgi:hypothetical protein